MRKLKSLREFKEEGLALEKKDQLGITGGDDSASFDFSDAADSSYYQDTLTPTSDCLRCACEDNPMLQTEENKKVRCVPSN